MNFSSKGELQRNDRQCRTKYQTKRPRDRDKGRQCEKQHDKPEPRTAHLMKRFSDRQSTAIIGEQDRQALLM
jgi:hypothetical protein